MAKRKMAVGAADELIAGLKRRLGRFGFDIQLDVRSPGMFGRLFVVTFKHHLPGRRTLAYQHQFTEEELSYDLVDHLIRSTALNVMVKSMDLLDPVLPTAEPPDWRTSSMVPEDFYAS